MKSVSLRVRLIILFSMALIVTWLIASSVAFFQINNDLREVFDSQQLLFAKRLASPNLQALLDDKQPQILPKVKSKQLKKLKVDDDALAFAIFSLDGQMLLNDGDNGAKFVYPRGMLNGKEPVIIQDVKGWRILWLQSSDSRYVVAVGQELDYRRDLAFDVIGRQMLPWLIMLPLLMLITILIINRELKPLKGIVGTLRTRRPDDATPIDGSSAPSEVKPLIDALNALFSRISSMLIRERRFTSDAAHELRTPLASLKIQTEVAQLADDDTEVRQHALSNLTQGIDRATHLVEQLLTLSRLDSLSDLSDVEEIDWFSLVQSTVEDLKGSAHQRNIDLQFKAYGTPAVRHGQPLLLSLLMRNLVDNALRYTPEGGKVIVYITHDGIAVEDNGPGIADDHLNRLGERFFRPPGQNEIGSGLGLSIVKQISTLHNLQVRFTNRSEGGLRVSLEWY